MFPREGQPLIPAPLSQHIGAPRISSHLRERFKLPASLRLRDLDERVWTEFPAESIPFLAQAVIDEVNRVQWKFKSITDAVPVDVSDPELSGYARNALIRSGVKRGVATTMELGRLIGVRGLGAKGLLEILVGPRSVRVSRGTRETAPTAPVASETGRDAVTLARKSVAVRKEATRLGRRRWATRVSATDPRLGRMILALHPSATTPKDAADLVSSASFDAPAARRKVAQIRALTTEAERLRALTLEAELEEIIVAMTKATARGRGALLARLGMNGAPPCTLEEAGRPVGLTRERVRQLEKPLKDAMSKSPVWAPVLEKALRIVADATPAWASHPSRLLQESGVTRGQFSIESLLSVAALLGRSPGFQFDRSSALLFKHGVPLSVRDVRSAARRLTSKWGAVSVEALAAEMRGQGIDLTDTALLRFVIDSIEDACWLDEEKGWFWLRDVPRNRMLNMIEKIVSVAGSITIGELREGVGRHYRTDGYRPPREVLATLCVKSELYRRDGDQIVEGPNLPPWEEVLAPLERTFAETLFRHGPIMRREDLERIVVDQEGMNRSSFYVYLDYSPILARYAPGVYGLRGARVTAAEVNALIPPRAWQQRLVDRGWTKDGRIWIAYKMSRSALQAAVLSVPAALQEFASGDYTLSAENGPPVGSLVVKGNHMWGVGPFYRQYGVEEGDHVVLTLDTKSRQATVTAGGEELLLRYQAAD